MADRQDRAASASGIAEVTTVENWCAEKVQVSVHGVTTGTGTVTLTVMPWATNEYQSIVDGTVDLSDATAPLTWIIEGQFQRVKASSSQSGDAFDLTVVELDRGH